MTCPARIGVDGRNIERHHGTGVAVYGAALCDGLRALGMPAELLLDGRAGAAGAPVPLLRRCRRAWSTAPCAAPLAGSERAGPHARAALPEGRFRVAEDVFRLAQLHFALRRRVLRLDGPDPPALMHWTYPLPLRLRGSLNIYTCHDLIPLLRPDLTGIGRARHARLMRAVLAGADHIVTVSEAARRDILGAFGCPGERVTNTYQAVSIPAAVAALSPPGLAEAVRAVTGLLPGGYFIHVGTIERRKNVARLLQAYLASGVTVPLVLAGPDGWQAAEQWRPAQGYLLDRQALAAEHASRRGVLRVAYLERDLLLTLLRGARGLLLPSLAEGFGLPVLEAMALGVPVLTSAGGATGEVAGDGAMLVDPLDIAAMASSIAEIDRSAGLRASLAERGRRRAGDFSMDVYTGRLGALYARLLSARVSQAR